MSTTISYGTWAERDDYGESFDQGVINSMRAEGLKPRRYNMSALLAEYRAAITAELARDGITWDHHDDALSGPPADPDEFGSTMSDAIARVDFDATVERHNLPRRGLLSRLAARLGFRPQATPDGTPVVGD